MLNEFLTTNRDELIARCREKVAQRFAPSETPAATGQGVPLFLVQLADTLALEHPTFTLEVSEPELNSRRQKIVDAAALHGAELLRSGYLVDQVVRDYGDVCQSVTELAGMWSLPISTDEFRIFNRCLDDAIAGAVVSFGDARQKLTNDLAANLHIRLDTFSGEHRRLVGIAIQSLSALKTGTVGLSGATGSLLTHTLEELRTLSERTLPEIHLLSEATTVTSR